MRHVILVLIIGLACWAPHAASASPFARDYCGVVVASRPTMDEAQEWISQNYRENSVLSAHRAGNGWIALVDGQIPSEGALTRLNQMKQQGEVPQDAFCSTGENFGAGVDIVAGGTSPTPVPTAEPEPQAAVDPLLAEFDARPFTAAEKRSIQAALAYEGHYLGKLDGKWGGGSQAALERWSRLELSSEPFGIHLGFLALILDGLEADGWSPVGNPGYLFDFVFPRATNRNSPNAVVVDAAFGGLSAERTQSEKPAMQQMHAQLKSNVARVGTPYLVREFESWITSITDAAGTTTYLRSDRRFDGAWEHAEFTAANTRGGDLALVVSSFGAAPVREIALPTTGAAAQLVSEARAQFAVWAAEDTDEESAVVDTPPVMARPGAPETPAPQTSGSYSGSGFVVNVAGYTVTNAHVIEDCTEIQVDGRTARAFASDTDNDLAVLWTGQQQDSFVRISPTGARLNADITVSGFPLSDLLSGLSITRGSVTALSGLRGEDRHFRVSAPVQAGNSGGPVFNTRAEVVGVVVGQLSDRIASNGDINRPQNVNFVIRVNRLEDFLTQNGIAFERSQGAPMSNEELAAHAQAVTVQVTCQ